MAKKLRFAAVSCPLAPQASHASSSVSRQPWALSSAVRPLLAVILIQQVKGQKHVINLFRRLASSAIIISHLVRCLHSRG
jgi:hypothetical protein